MSTDKIELQPERTRRRLEVSGLAHGERIVGVQEIADQGGFGHQFVEQLQPFRRNGADEKADARDIAARPVEAGDEAKLDRVAAAGENDWYRRGDRLGRQRRTAIRENRRDLTADEFEGLDVCLVVQRLTPQFGWA